ncbi:hypothetical protein DL95DRAFT_457462 [Leptodontidium sp. 2 PMI_412]|nr:hypothetical protein DL95DRAFT_457462 [Leptodontidium sp. 2 PMI_412]
MHLVTATLALLTTLLSPSSAAPAPQITVTPGAPTPWNRPLTSGVKPAFSMFCSGFDLRNKMVPCAKPEILANLVPTTDQGLVLQVNRFEKQGNDETAVMSGDATVAPSGEPAYENFVVEACSLGVVVG